MPQCTEWFRGGQPCYYLCNIFPRVTQNNSVSKGIWLVTVSNSHILWRKQTKKKQDTKKSQQKALYAFGAILVTNTKWSYQNTFCPFFSLYVGILEIIQKKSNQEMQQQLSNIYKLIVSSWNTNSEDIFTYSSHFPRTLTEWGHRPTGSRQGKSHHMFSAACDDNSLLSVVGLAFHLVLPLAVCVSSGFGWLHCSTTSPEKTIPEVPA